MKHLVAACLLILLAACEGGPEPPGGDVSGNAPPVTSPPAAERPATPPTGGDWTVTPRGAGPVRLGMSLEEARGALGEEPVQHGVPGESCLHIDPGGSAPEGLAFMVVDERVVRVDVFRDSTAVTSVDLRPGDSEARALDLLGTETEVTPHKYVDGHYLTAPAGEEGIFWVIETDGERVTALRVGFEPEVHWIEGCS